MSKTNESTTNAASAAPLTLLQSFEGLGMFASRDVRADTIELPDGKKAQFYVRELPDAEFRKLWQEADRSKLIAATICDEDGKAVMNTTQAAQLKPLIAAKLQQIAMKHSGFGDEAAEAQAETGND